MNRSGTDHNPVVSDVSVAVLVVGSMTVSVATAMAVTVMITLAMAVTVVTTAVTMVVVISLAVVVATGVMIVRVVIINCRVRSMNAASRHCRCTLVVLRPSITTASAGKGAHAPATVGQDKEDRDGVDKDSHPQLCEDF